MKYVIDRFENDLAVLEVNGDSVPIPRSLLPEEAAEGDSVGITLIPADPARSERLSRRFRLMLKKADNK